MVVWLNSLKTTIAEVKDHPQGEHQETSVLDKGLLL